jgi:hypothetical protein
MSPRTGCASAATPGPQRLSNWCRRSSGESAPVNNVSRPAVGGPTKWGARSRGRSAIPMKWSRLAWILVGAAFAALALRLGTSERVYELSILGGISGGIVVRKLASLVIFAVAGILGVLILSPRPNARMGVAAISGLLLSAGIELLQYPEPWGDVAFDLVCGLVGGAAGAALLKLFVRD